MGEIIGVKCIIIGGGKMRPFLTKPPTPFCAIPLIKSTTTKSNLTTNSSIIINTPTIWTTNKYYYQRRSMSCSNSPYFGNDSASIDSLIINNMQTKIKEELNAESVIVKDAYGDGRHVRIDVISSAFEGQSDVSRQRMVYNAIWEELQIIVHAVDQMTTKTPSEAASE